ncbi:MAG: histidinol dehydrogenase [Actinomycetia bacterium]|nr:histidinol dehydrogenase [Actinomycetes bacterium]
MLNRLDLRGVTDPGPLLPRPEIDGDDPVAAVRDIIDQVRTHGDQAVRELTARFDGVELDDLRVDPTEVKGALDRVPGPLVDALGAAAANIDAYHRTQLHPDVTHEKEGVRVRSLTRPFERVGLYVPGGRAEYPSTVLMTAIPARVAGVAEIALCVPPNRETGRIGDAVLAGAAVAGVDEVYAIGGAQAVAAMAYGTESIRAVDGIAGPGNIYVAIAKREVAGTVSIPSAFAGPSEVVVIGDGAVPASWAAIDVILQAEHGPDGLAWLVTWDEGFLDEVNRVGSELLDQAPRRDEILSTLESSGYAVLVDSPEQAIEVSNLIAPEHLELLVADPDALLASVRHAGAVFTSPLAPASTGDYVAGPSHVLPTNGTARFSSALTVADFQKHIHVVDIDQEGFDRLAPHVIALAETEGLDAHAESIRLRQARPAERAEARGSGS